MTLLSSQGVEHLRQAVEARGVSKIAQILGVSRNSLASVLLGRGRPSTSKVIAAAYVAKAGQLAGAGK